MSDSNILSKRFSVKAPQQFFERKFVVKCFQNIFPAMTLQSFCLPTKIGVVPVVTFHLFSLGIVRFHECLQCTLTNQCLVVISLYCTILTVYRQCKVSPCIASEHYTKGLNFSVKIYFL